MPLYIRDEDVNRLAERLAVVSTNGNKTEAVRQAIENELARLASRESLGERVRRLQDRAARLGLGPDGFDDKPLMDALSGGL